MTIPIFQFRDSLPLIHRKMCENAFEKMDTFGGCLCDLFFDGLLLLAWAISDDSVLKTYKELKRMLLYVGQVVDAISKIKCYVVKKF